MAKKRVARKTEFKDNTTQDVVKKYGNVIQSGLSVFEESKNLKTIPVSPAIDLALGGGIKIGKNHHCITIWSDLSKRRVGWQDCHLR